MALDHSTDEGGTRYIHFDGITPGWGGTLSAQSSERPSLFIGGSSHFTAHLDQATVAELLPYLLGFVLTGKLEPHSGHVSAREVAEAEPRDVGLE